MLRKVMIIIFIFRYQRYKEEKREKNETRYGIKKRRSRCHEEGRFNENLALQGEDQ